MRSICFPYVYLVHNTDGTSQIGWWRIKTEYKKCKRNLEIHLLEFEENLEEFLLPVIPSEEKLRSLLDNPGSLKWEDPELEVALKDRMPKTYDAYVKTIKMLGKTIEDLDKALGINKIHFQDRVSDRSVSFNVDVSTSRMHDTDTSLPT